MWVSAKFDDAIPRNDGVYIAGIIFNTRRRVAVSVGGRGCCRCRASEWSWECACIAMGISKVVQQR